MSRRLRHQNANYGGMGIDSRKNLTLRERMPHGKSYSVEFLPKPLTHGIWVIDSKNILPSDPPALQASMPKMPGSLRGSAPQRGSRGWPPGLSGARQPALARRDGESFREREGTHRNAWCPPSL